jgi:hypothetical protein
MSADKIHCLTDKADVLTSNGWKNISKITMDDEIATLNQNTKVLEYHKPTAVHTYPDYEGKMYQVLSDQVDLDVTANHKMYVALDKSSKFQLIRADEIIGKDVKYKLDVINTTNKDGYYLFPSIISKLIDKDVARNNGYAYKICYKTGDKTRAKSKDTLPAWIFKLTPSQIDTIITYYQCIDCNYTVDCELLYCAKDAFLQNGLPSWIWKLNSNELNVIMIYLNEHQIQINNDDMLRLKLLSNKIINGSITNKLERLYDYKGTVYCVSVPNEVFYVRQNGKSVWTGNSRSSGPVVQLTRQPAEGRSRDGGLRMGEMERDCLIAHGTLGFLKERMTDVSDIFNIYVCQSCGLFASANPELDKYKCHGCQQYSQISLVQIPYACKLLMQELQGMMITPRFVLNGDEHTPCGGGLS